MHPSPKIISHNPADARLEGWLQVALQQPFACLLESREGIATHPADSYLWLLAWGTQPITTLPELEAAQLDADWHFGALPYSLKDVFEPSLSSSATSQIPWPEVAFFRAAGAMWQLRGSDTVHNWGEQLPSAFANAAQQGGAVSNPVFLPNFTQAGYMAAAERLREHIRQGDVYEVNLSQQFTATGFAADPLTAYQAFTAASPTPMAGLLKWQDRYLISASPERFLRRQGQRLTTQPIKGTARRAADPAQDAAIRAALATSVKEQAENVMIVDLARNDLNRICTPGTVVAEQLFEVQSFQRLHHLVSTVAGELRPGVGLSDILRATFPPGSMTGAPKVAAMQLIDDLEQADRGLYAGSLGYIVPGGDFDFNVVIRSLVYDAGTGIAQYNVGGAITYDSDPLAEYHESLLKAEALQAALASLG